MSLLATAAEEYRMVTEACGLLDRSARGKLALTGGEAKSFLQGQVSNDVEALTPGSGCYAAFLTPKGKMLGDLRILDTGDELLLDTERNALQGLFNMIRRFSIGYDVALHKRTVERALFSVIGPAADALLADEPLAGPAVPRTGGARRRAARRRAHRRSRRQYGRVAEAGRDRTRAGAPGGRARIVRDRWFGARRRRGRRAAVPLSLRRKKAFELTGAGARPGRERKLRRVRMRGQERLDDADLID